MSDSTKTYTISANGDTASADRFTHAGGLLRIMRHDAATVSAGTTKFQFFPVNGSGLKDVKDQYGTLQFTESGFREVSLPPCVLSINTASYSGPGNITIQITRPSSLHRG